MIGYEFLLSKIGIPMMPLRQPARIKPVTRVESIPEMLAIPRQVAPDDDSILSHVLFALRYETIQTPVLEQALRLVPADELLVGLARQPQGGYDQAFEKIDKAYDLPNKTINLLIQWIHQNNCRMPERRKNAPELILLKPGQLDEIEAIVAEAFGMKDAAETYRQCES